MVVGIVLLMFDMFPLSDYVLDELFLNQVAIVQCPISLRQGFAGRVAGPDWSGYPWHPDGSGHLWRKQYLATCIGQLNLLHGRHHDKCFSKQKSRSEGLIGKPAFRDKSLSPMVCTASPLPGHRAM